MVIEEQVLRLQVSVTGGGGRRGRHGRKTWGRQKVKPTCKSEEGWMEKEEDALKGVHIQMYIRTSIHTLACISPWVNISLVNVLVCGVQIILIYIHTYIRTIFGAYDRNPLHWWFVWRTSLPVTRWKGWHINRVKLEYSHTGKVLVHCLLHTLCGQTVHAWLNTAELLGTVWSAGKVFGSPVSMTGTQAVRWANTLALLLHRYPDQA